jgi:hypothetical protein
MIPDPSLRSGFRLWTLPFVKLRVRVTPAKRLNLAGGDLIGDGFGEDVNLTHRQRPATSGQGQFRRSKDAKAKNLEG